MLSIEHVARFKRDLKKYQCQMEILSELNTILKLILAEQSLSRKYRDHPLIGGYASMRECHLRPDVLLIY